MTAFFVNAVGLSDCPATISNAMAARPNPPLQDPHKIATLKGSLSNRNRNNRSNKRRQRHNTACFKCPQTLNGFHISKGRR